MKILLRSLKVLNFIKINKSFKFISFFSCDFIKYFVFINCRSVYEPDSKNNEGLMGIYERKQREKEHVRTETILWYFWRVSFHSPAYRDVETTIFWMQVSLRWRRRPREMEVLR